jgi:hypothetical protein
MTSPFIGIEKASAVSLSNSNKASTDQWALATVSLVYDVEMTAVIPLPCYRRMRAVHFGFGSAIRREKLLRAAGALSVAVGSLPSDPECDAASSA